MGSSQTSRSYQPRDEGRGLRAVAAAQLSQRTDLELLVYGHSHVATLERTVSGGVYANAGSWLDAPTYLLATPDRIALREWRGSAEGPDLHALDRNSASIACGATCVPSLSLIRCRRAISPIE